MFYVTGFNGSNIVTVYDDTDKSSEHVWLVDLEENWDRVGHLFVTKFYSKPFDNACTCGLNTTLMAPFDIIDSSGILYVTEILKSLGVYNYSSFQSYIEQYTIIYEDSQHVYRGTNFCIALRNDFINNYKFIPQVYNCIKNSCDINNSITMPIVHLLTLYYNNRLQIKYNLSPFLFYQFEALNTYTEDNLYVVEFDSEEICIWYFLASIEFGLVTRYHCSDSAIRLKDFFPDIIKSIAKVTGVLRPEKFMGNKLYFKASGRFKTLPEVAKILTMKGKVNIIGKSN